MRERTRLRQIFFEAEGAGEGAGDLHHFEGMGEPGPVVIALMKHEDLGLVREPTERGRMDDPVAIAAKHAAGQARRLRMQPAAAPRRIGGVGRAPRARVNCHLRLAAIDQSRADT